MIKEINDASKCKRKSKLLLARSNDFRIKGFKDRFIKIKLMKIVKDRIVKKSNNKNNNKKKDYN